MYVCLSVSWYKVVYTITPRKYTNCIYKYRWCLTLFSTFNLRRCKLHGNDSEQTFLLINFFVHNVFQNCSCSWHSKKKGNANPTIPSITCITKICMMSMFSCVHNKPLLTLIVLFINGILGLVFPSFAVPGTTTV